MAKGVQGKLGRVRPPKVQITFDVEDGGAMVKKEIPFVVGVLADLSNRPVVDEEGDKIPVRARKFKEIDRDNFADFMAATAPEATVRVDNKLDDSGGTLAAKVVFQSMDDFRPDHLARKIPALRELLDVREMLADIKGKIDGNQKLEKELQAIIAKTLEATGKLGEREG